MVGSDPVLWLVGNGKTHNPNITVGPAEDATDSAGMYAYMDFTKDGLNKSMEGRMISTPMPQTDATCFSFWTNIFGKRMGYIHVQRVTYNIYIDKPFISGGSYKWS